MTDRPAAQIPGYARRDYAWQPPAYAPDYKTTVARSPRQKLISLEHSVGEITGPTFGHDDVMPGDADLLTNYAASGHSAIGERIFLHGRILDEDGRPVPDTLVEIWQANAGGRYRHRNDTYFAPIDPNFGGCGRVVTDAEGRYRFHTVKPGAYPWPNGPNTWRPAHIHVSVFGRAFTQRLITQCYFEGDPLIPLCAIVQTIKDPAAIDQLVARLDMDSNAPHDSIAYRFDVILRGRAQTYFENRPEGG